MKKISLYIDRRVFSSVDRLDGDREIDIDRYDWDKCDKDMDKKSREIDKCRQYKRVEK